MIIGIDENCGNDDNDSRKDTTNVIIDEVIDDWGLASLNVNGTTTTETLATTSNSLGENFQLFAQHEIHNIYIPFVFKTNGITKTTVDVDDENANDDNHWTGSTTSTADDGGTTTLDYVGTTTNQMKNSYSYNEYIKFPLYCVESLTPIDMINMSNGTHDSTGHCVWTGSFLLIAALSYPISLSTSITTVAATTTGTSNIENVILKSSWSLYDECFFGDSIGDSDDDHTNNNINNNNKTDTNTNHNNNNNSNNNSNTDNNNQQKQRQKNVLELGCGTGIATIALLNIQSYRNNQRKRNNSSNNKRQYVPMNDFAIAKETTNATPSNVVVMTDADPEALRLSERNYRLNFSSTSSSSSVLSNSGADTTTTGIATVLNSNNKDCTNDDCTNNKDDCFYRYHHQDGQDVVITTLVWGGSSSSTTQEELESKSKSSTSSSFISSLLPCSSSSFDTVYATDVLYDIGLLPSILQTVQECLSSSSSTTTTNDHGTTKNINSNNKYFVLSHVPRACYNSSNPPPPPKLTNSHDSNNESTKTTPLEDIIISNAAMYNLQLVHIIRPTDILVVVPPSSSSSSSPMISGDENMKDHDNVNGTKSNCNNNDTFNRNYWMPSDALNNTTLQEMDEIGAAILIFKYTAT